MNEDPETWVALGRHMTPESFDRSLGIEDGVADSYKGQVSVAHSMGSAAEVKPNAIPFESPCYRVGRSIQELGLAGTDQVVGRRGGNLQDPERVPSAGV